MAWVAVCPGGTGERDIGGGHDGIAPGGMYRSSDGTSSEPPMHEGEGQRRPNMHDFGSGTIDVSGGQLL